MKIFLNLFYYLAYFNSPKFPRGLISAFYPPFVYIKLVLYDCINPNLSPALSYTYKYVPYYSSVNYLYESIYALYSLPFLSTSFIANFYPNHAK